MAIIQGEMASTLLKTLQSTANRSAKTEASSVPHGLPVRDASGTEDDLRDDPRLLTRRNMGLARAVVHLPLEPKHHPSPQFRRTQFPSLISCG